MGVQPVTLVDGAVVQSPSTDVTLQPAVYRDVQLDITAPEGSTLYSVTSAPSLSYASLNPPLADFPFTTRAASQLASALGMLTTLRICHQPGDGVESAPFCLYVFTNDAGVELARIRAHGLEQALTSQQLIRWNVESRAEAPNAFLDPSRSARAFTSRTSGTEAGGRDRFFYQAPE